MSIAGLIMPSILLWKFNLSNVKRKDVKSQTGGCQTSNDKPASQIQSLGVRLRTFGGAGGSVRGRQTCVACGWCLKGAPGGNTRLMHPGAGRHVPMKNRPSCKNRPTNEGLQLPRKNRHPLFCVKGSIDAGLRLVLKVIWRWYYLTTARSCNYV